jgi:hypothetical protein
MDRLCRLVYNDCDYSEKNGLEKVLKRKMVSCINEEGNVNGNGQTVNNTPTPVVAKESVLAGIGRIFAIKEEKRWVKIGEKFNFIY